MKFFLIFIAFFKYSSGLDFDLDGLDFKTVLDGLSNDCPVAQSEGCPPELTYWLYTKGNQNGVQLDENQIKSAGFLDKKQLKVLIHGYQNDHQSLMITSLVKGYLDYGEFNIIAVDWGHFVKPGCYFQGVNSINPVAGCAAAFLKKVMAEITFENVHVLGHSLGAHAAARLSTKFDNPKLDRLTRFDPALPLFSVLTTEKGMADFRDTYHSNTGILGQSPEQGDIDVYLNSDHFQPGCQCSLACSHLRSVLYFAESIGKGMQGFYCSAWENFLDGKCHQPTTDTLKEIGDNADRTQTNSSFKVFGRDKAPFLYSKEDYLDPEKFKQFRNLGKDECINAIKDKIKEKVIDFLKSTIKDPDL